MAERPDLDYALPIVSESLQSARNVAVHLHKPVILRLALSGSLGDAQVRVGLLACKGDVLTPTKATQPHSVGASKQGFRTFSATPSADRKDVETKLQ